MCSTALLSGMATPLPPLASHSTRPRSTYLTHPISALERSLSSLKCRRQQSLHFARFPVRHARHFHESKSFKVQAEKASPTDSELSEMHKRGSSSQANQITHHNLLLKILALAVLVAAAFSILAVLQPQSSKIIVGSELVGAGPSYKVKLLGKELLIGERSPGWIYFWLLMAAGFGLFVSEEALNVWVGAVLARTLTFDSSWSCLSNSVFANGRYIFSTLFWVYWGVCISDMVPFYAGRYAAQSKAGETLRKKVGVSEAKMETISQTVKRYGNLIGFVERFSLGVRNPTAFVAGAMGVSPNKFFTGVCLGALITMPLQMGVGCILRHHPVKAVAGVAAAVAAWTGLPYVAAGIASVGFFIWSKLPIQSSRNSSSSSTIND